ncbi:MAG TPA: hypothetical protein VN784_11995 [Candidatus Limnocylindrales bacterium]|nr:hypothetical protein [Candidatus Limnocylindrales bacterium]
MEQFERRLSRQPFRQVPAEWREEILAEAGRGSKVEGRAQKRLWLSSLVPRLSSVLWPHPVAWAGLTAIWIFIFAVDTSLRDRPSVVVISNSSPPAEIIVEVRQQQRLLAELLGPREPREADRSKSAAPRPRSEFTGILSV